MVTGRMEEREMKQNPLFLILRKAHQYLLSSNVPCLRHFKKASKRTRLEWQEKPDSGTRGLTKWHFQMDLHMLFFMPRICSLQCPCSISSICVPKVPCAHSSLHQPPWVNTSYPVLPITSLCTDFLQRIYHNTCFTCTFYSHFLSSL